MTLLYGILSNQDKAYYSVFSRVVYRIDDSTLVFDEYDKLTGINDTINQQTFYFPNPGLSYWKNHHKIIGILLQ